MIRDRAAVLTQADGRSWTFSTATQHTSAIRFVLEDITGWFGGGSGVRADAVPREGHGEFRALGSRTGRTLSILAGITAPDAETRGEIERDFASMLWDGQWGTLRVLEATGRVLTSDVRLDNAPTLQRVGSRHLRVVIPLVSDSPFLYGDEITTFLEPIGTGIGLQYPLGSGRTNPQGVPVMAYGTAVTSQDPIGNPGNADAWPVFVVVGDFPTGFQISVGREVVNWPVMTVPQSPVTVDMGGTITVNGQNMTHLAGRRDWIKVGPEEVVFPRFQPHQPGSGFCEIHLRPTYI